MREDERGSALARGRGGGGRGAKGDNTGRQRMSTGSGAAVYQALNAATETR